jgi:hypothetical protein
MACGGGWRGPPVGVAAPRGLDRAADVDGGEPAEPSPVPADFRTTMTRVRDRALSRGHGERFDGIVWANATATATATATTAATPDGALYVEEAIERGPSGDRPAGLLVMERRGGVWRYLAVMPSGEVVTGQPVAACVACHREAPADEVFPP